MLKDRGHDRWAGDMLPHALDQFYEDDAWLAHIEDVPDAPRVLDIVQLLI